MTARGNHRGFKKATPLFGRKKRRSLCGCRRGQNWRETGGADRVEVGRARRQSKGDDHDDCSGKNARSRL